MNEPYTKVFMLAVCRECGVAYICNPGTGTSSTPLPCGHINSAIFTTSPLEAYIARDMLEWLDKNGCVLPDVFHYADLAGGQLYPLTGLKVPGRDLTEQEIDEMNGG